MSHFAVGVVVPSNIMNDDVDTILRFISKVMDPFSVYTEVKPYIIMENIMEKNRAEEHLKERLRSIRELLENTSKDTLHDTYRTELENKYSKLKDLTPDEYWNQHCIGTYFNTESGLDIFGNILSTYNPQSKWDLWEIGGYLDGHFHNVNDEVVDIIDYKNSKFAIEANSITIGKYISNITDHILSACVTSNGEWVVIKQIEQPGINRNKLTDEECNKLIISTLENENQDDYLILIDCHI